MGTHNLTMRQKLNNTIIDEESGCHLWQGNKHVAGYGRVFWKGVSTGAHVLSYVMVHGPIKYGTHVKHTCKNKHCINVDHLTTDADPLTMEEQLDRHNYPDKIYKI